MLGGSAHNCISTMRGQDLPPEATRSSPSALFPSGQHLASNSTVLWNGGRPRIGCRRRCLYSMDMEDQRIQRLGYVKAFRDPEVIRAVRAAHPSAVSRSPMSSGAASRSRLLHGRLSTASNVPTGFLRSQPGLYRRKPSRWSRDSFLDSLSEWYAQVACSD
jgi:hypothetical protein